MNKKENVFCDVETGICGPKDAPSGIMNFVDLSAPKEEEEEASSEQLNTE